MKKTILLLLVAFGIHAAAQTKGAKKPAAAAVNVPANVSTRFGSDYPNITPKWSMDGKHYAATFTDSKSGMGKTAVYDKKADFVRSDMEMNAGYPEAIGAYFKKNYPKEKYTVWSSMDDYGEMLYYSKRKGKMIWFDKNGAVAAKRPGHYK